MFAIEGVSVQECQLLSPTGAEHTPAEQVPLLHTVPSGRSMTEQKPLTGLQLPIWHSVETQLELLLAQRSA